MPKIANNKALNKTSFSHQFFSWTDLTWVIQRATAILIIPCVLLANIPILTILVILASFHLYIGVTEILTDYIHHEVTRLLLNILFSVLVLVFLKESFIILVSFF
jgi:succinate dehydrogenase hydrophobic anchor subunit